MSHKFSKIILGSFVLCLWSMTSLFAQEASDQTPIQNAVIESPVASTTTAEQSAVNPQLIAVEPDQALPAQELPAVKEEGKGGEDTQAIKIEKPEDKKDVIQPVEVNGDHMEFVQSESKVVIDGNVVITKGDIKLRCDHVEYFNLTKNAFATGNVILSMSNGEIRGKQLAFNFGEMSGELQEAKILSNPYYGQTEVMTKVNKDKIKMTRGYITTCDLDKPHYKMYAKDIDVYPGKLLKAKSIRFMAGKMPLAYIPSMTQDISGKKPIVLYTPGMSKNWGFFLLTLWRYQINENLKGALHIDMREKRGVGGGFDSEYKLPNFGDGLFKMYFINERVTGKKRWFTEKTQPTVMKERYKYEWRHKWNIDPTAQAIWQYYSYSDSSFLKDYFWRDFERDAQPETYFLFTKNFQTGTFNFRMDKRVNRFVSTVQRLPEFGYTLGSQQIASSNIYLQSDNLFSNLSLPSVSPTEVRLSTTRLDTKNKFSYPAKVAFIDVTPYVAQRETFYTKTKETSRYNIIRSIFETGATLTTKFYRTFDINGNFWGMELNKVRHIITPQVDYLYRHTPSFPADELDVFDSGIDSINRGHSLNLSLENRLQTKRNGKNVDLLRVIGKSDFLLKEDIGKGSFNTVTSDIEFRPVDWLTFYSDTTYNAQTSKLSTANFDMYINGGNGWQLSLGRRLEVEGDDEFTTDLVYRLNPKWKFRIYDRFDIGGGGQKEQGYTITRDLHCWEVDFNYNETRGMGSELWVVFRLKAFPDEALDLFGTSFNRRKAGSQSGP